MIRRVLKFLTLLTAGVVAGILLAHRTVPAIGPHPTDDQILAEAIPDVNIDSTTYRGFAQYLRGIDPNVVVDWPSLAGGDIAPQCIYPDTPLMLDWHLHHVRFEQLFDITYAGLGNDDTRVNCTIGDGIIFLQARKFYNYEPDHRDADDMEHYIDDRRYDVRDLLRTDGPWEKLAVDAMGNAPPPGPLSREKRRELLTATIQRVVDPDSWLRHNDGAQLVGRQQIYHGYLIVSQLPANLDSIAEMLARFRAAR